MTGDREESGGVVEQAAIERSLGMGLHFAMIGGFAVVASVLAGWLEMDEATVLIPLLGFVLGFAVSIGVEVSVNAE